MKVTFLCLVIIFGLISCSSLPKSSDGNNTMVIGGSTTNLEKNKIEIYIKSYGSNEILKANIRKEIFYFVNLSDTDYYFFEIKDRKNNLLYKIPENNNFNIENNCVNNIGLILLINNNLVLLDQHSIVKNNFKKMYKNSDWNNKRWIDYKWQEVTKRQTNSILSNTSKQKVINDELLLLLRNSAENSDFMDENFKPKGVDELNFSEIDTMESIRISEDELLQFILEGHLNNSNIVE